MILCIGTTPAAQRVMIFPRVKVDQVNRATSTLDGAAGKAINVAKVLHALGAPTVVTGFIGGERGKQLMAMLNARGVACDFVTVNAPTRECVTVIDQSARTVTELVEESQPATPVNFEQLLKIIHKRMAHCQAVVMSGTVAGGGPQEFYSHCTRSAHRVKALSVVDASGPPLLDALTARPALVKPNRSELERTVGRPLQTEESLRLAIEEIHARGAERVVVTDGANPVMAFDGSRYWRVLSPELTAVNPIGSGDAFTAALTWRLTLGEDLGDACRWACAAGAANALTSMAGELAMEDVHRLLASVRVSPISRR